MSAPMVKVRRVVTDSMEGLTLADYAQCSSRVVTVLGQNPGQFTGPGTNTYLVGSGSRRLLLDTGSGAAAYPAVLDRALAELCAGAQVDRVVVTHAHPDHVGGIGQVRARFGPVAVLKKRWPQADGEFAAAITPLEDGAVVGAEGATLRAIYTPGHAPDHLCFYLVEERALFTGDLVLGAGTAVIPEDSGDLGQYMASLERLCRLEIETIYPAHGPVVRRPKEKLRDYIAHRQLRERQILEVLANGPLEPIQIVRHIYQDVTPALHPAAESSVRSHLKKLVGEGRVARTARGFALA